MYERAATLQEVLQLVSRYSYYFLSEQLSESSQYVIVMTKTVTSSRKSRGCVSFFMAQASLESLGVVSTGESLVEKNLIH